LRGYVHTIAGTGVFSVSPIMPFRRTILAMALLLAGCGSPDDAALTEQVAIAKEAADRAVKAQKAAERAASLARSQSAPASFGEDEIIEEIDDSSADDSSTSGGDDSAEDVSASSVPR
jgi:hypothetical protein